MANKAEIIISAKDESRIAFESVRGSLAQLGTASSALTSTLGTLGPLLGAATFASFLKGGIDSLDMLGDLSDRTGVAANTLAGFKLVAAQSDTSLEALGKGLNKLSVYMGENGEAAAKLGITAKDPAEAFIQLSKVLTGIEEPQQRAAVANKLLGKSYQELLPALLQGEDALRKQIDAGKSYANVTPEMVKQAQDFNDELDALKTKLSSAGVILEGPFLAGLNDVIVSFQDARIAGVGFFGTLAAFGTSDTDIGPKIKETQSRLNDLQKSFDNLDPSKSFANKLNDVVYGDRLDLSKQIAVAKEELKSLQALDDINQARIKKKEDSGKSKQNFNIDTAADFLKGDSKSDADNAKLQIDLLNQENKLIAQGVSIEDAKTIAQLKQKGIGDETIVQMLNMQEQSRYLAGLEKDRGDLLKAIQGDIDDETKAREDAYKTRLEQDKSYEDARAAIRLDAGNREIAGVDLKNTIDESLVKEAQQLQFNLSIQNLSTKEQQKQIALHDEELAFEKDIYDLNQAGVYLDEQQTEALKAQHDEIANLKGSLKDNNNVAKEFGLIFKSSAEDAITDWKGFGNLIDSIEQDIEKMLIRKTVTEPFIKAIDGIDFSSLFSEFTANALGNVYSGASISAYSGSVVSQPTFFANGGNVMGEAGPEGIFPLKRGADGKLGIQASGNGGGTTLTVNLIESPGNGGQVNQSQSGNNMTLDIMVEKIESMMGQNISKGRGISPIMERQYGLNRSPGSY